MKKLCDSIYTAILSFGCIAVTMSSGSSGFAEQMGQRWLFDTPYANIGDWRVIGSTDVDQVCIAEIDNDQVSLRVMYNHTDDLWFIGNPYYENDHPTADFGFGEKNALSETIEMQTDVVEGWAMYDFSTQRHLLDAISEGQYLSIKLDRGVQSWQMLNKARALSKLAACAKDMGARANDMASPTVPMKAPQKLTLASESYSCPEPGSVTSPGSSTEITVEFRDAKYQELAKTVYWVGFDGELIEVGPIFDGRIHLTSYAGHKFLVKDHQGNCYGGLHTVGDSATTFTID